MIVCFDVNIDTIRASKVFEQPVKLGKDALVHLTFLNFFKIRLFHELYCEVEKNEKLLNELLLNIHQT